MAISVGSVEVDIVPNTRGIYGHLRSALVPAATKAGRDAGDAAGRAFGPAMRQQIAGLGLSIGQQIGQQIAVQITAAVRNALRQGVTQGARTARPAAVRGGEQAGGAFARAARARIEAAFRSLPDVTIGANTAEADADIQALRTRLEALSGQRIGVDIDAADARAQIEEIDAELHRLGAAHPNVTVRADTARARAELAALKAEIDRISADPTRVRVETDGTFGQRLRAAVQQAEASLPNINIDADTSEAAARIANLRAQLTALRDQRIGIDIDAATALAKVEDIQARLQRLSASDVDVAVRVDAAAATAQLAQVRAMVAALDGKKADVRIDTSGALRALLQLSVALLAVPAIPAIPVIAAGLGSVTAAATAAAIGVGALAAVAVPAIMDIAKALQAQKAARDAATTADAKGEHTAAQAAARDQRRALQMSGAQAALATAHRTAARQVRNAQRAVADAVQQAADAHERATAQAERAQQAVADAVRQAADRQRDAAARVAQAERGLRDAQVDARQAQQNLTQARRDAAQQLQDMELRLAGAQLAERDAVLGVQRAHERLTEAQRQGSGASRLDREEAQLAYDQAVQRLAEQRRETERLAAEKRDADRAGVEGSDAVRGAQDRLADAQQGVRDQAAAVAEAQREQARTAAESAQAVAEAQRAVVEAQAEARRAQADGAEAIRRAEEALGEARVTAADSVASAQRQVASAEMETVGAADQAAVAQAKYDAALAALSPSARTTFDALMDLKAGFGDWSKSLQPDVMPLFTRALDGLRDSLPALTPLVHEAAEGVGEVQDRASRGFDKPWWQTFRRDLTDSVRPAIVGVGTAFGNVFKGMMGVVGAFLPHMDSISETMQRITGRFANWGVGLRGSPGFERFLEYSAEQAPIVAEFLGDIGHSLFEVAHALEPLSGPVMEVLGAIARGIASIAETLPWVIQGMYLAFVATRVWTLAMVVFNVVTRANPLMLLVTAIVAVVAAVIYAYKRWGWFRKGVQAAWHGIQVAAEFAWTRILKPALEGIWIALQAVGNAATWLWKTILMPAFDAIGIIAKTLFTVVVTLALAPMVVAVQALGSAVSTLWDTVIEPVFTAIGAAATWLWEESIGPVFTAIGDAAGTLWKMAIKPAFEGIGQVFSWWYTYVVKFYFGLAEGALDALGDAFGWLLDKAIVPVFQGIRDTLSTAWSKGLSPVFTQIKTAVRLVGDAFNSAKEAIKKAWGKIKDVTKGPVNFVIGAVYTRGIKAVWDKVASFVGLSKLPKAPKLLAAGGTVGPGWGPAAPMVTSRPTAIVGEGNPRHPEYVIPTDPRYRPRARALWEAAGTQLLADGGIIGGAWDWTKDVAGTVTGWAKSGVDLMTDPGKVWDRLIGPVRDRIRDIGSSQWARMIGRIPTMMISGLKSRLVDAVTSLLGSGVDGWVGEWLNPVIGGRFGTRFGARGSMWASGQHTGLDIVAPTGTPVRAVADGSITRATSGGSYGKHIEISHGGNLSSLYAHLSAIDADFGFPVKAGQTIGRVGATGNVTGPHLHLEARRGPRAVDPLPYLQGKVTGLGSRSPEAAQRYARSILSNYGWGRDQWPPLRRLWEAESGWRWNARNPSSGAYGIPQSLPDWKMAAQGKDWRTNPATQIKWGLGYIRARPDYRSPAGAWAMWQSRSPHWYDSGGYLPEGLSLAYNGTGRPEAVITHQQERALLSIAANRAAAAPDLGDLSVHVYVGDREITDIARAEVRAATGRLVSTIRAR